MTVVADSNGRIYSPGGRQMLFLRNTLKLRGKSGRVALISQVNVVICQL